MKFVKMRFNSQGFALMDILVASAIIVVLSALVVTNMTDFRQTSSLKAETERLTSLIRQAQLWALAGQTRGGVRPPGGWGVHLEECGAGACTYFLYADMSSPANYTYEAVDDEIVSQIYLNEFIEISSLVPPSLADPVTLDINFVSPQADAWLNGAQDDNQATVTFLQTTAGDVQTVTIGRLTNRVELESVVKAPPPPPPPPEFADDFDADPGELSQHQPSNGSGWTQIISVKDGIEEGSMSMTLRANASGYLDKDSCKKNDGAIYYANDAPSKADYEVSVYYNKDDRNDDYSIIAARIQDDRNMYAFQWSRDRAELWVRSDALPGSGWNQLWNGTNGISKGSKVTLKVEGIALRVLVDGVDLFSSINDTTHTAAGYAGIGMGGVISGGNCDKQRLDVFEVVTF